MAWRGVKACLRLDAPLQNREIEVWGTKKGGEKQVLTSDCNKERGKMMSEGLGKPNNYCTATVEPDGGWRGQQDVCFGQVLQGYKIEGKPACKSGKEGNPERVKPAVIRWKNKTARQGTVDESQKIVMVVLDATTVKKTA